MAGEIKHISTSSLKKGSYINVDGIASTVTDISISRPGKHGHAKANIMAVGMIDGKKRNMVTGDHEVEAPVIGKKNAQVLSINADHANVMDSETYETFDLAIPKELQGTVAEGNTIVYWEIMTDRVMKQVKND
ncbi:MAG: translation initiation factor IF-5A [Candidatus Woesearchaeota archaeon]